MPAASGAVILRPRQQQLEVALGGDTSGQRLVEAGPASAAVEFGLGAEEMQEAGRANEGSRPLLPAEGLENDRSVEASNRIAYRSAGRSFLHSALDFFRGWNPSTVFASAIDLSFPYRHPRCGGHGLEVEALEARLPALAVLAREGGMVSAVPPPVSMAQAAARAEPAATRFPHRAGCDRAN